MRCAVCGVTLIVGTPWMSSDSLGSSDAGRLKTAAATSAWSSVEGSFAALAWNSRVSDPTRKIAYVRYAQPDLTA